MLPRTTVFQAFKVPSRASAGAAPAPPPPPPLPVSRAAPAQPAYVDGTGDENAAPPYSGALNPGSGGLLKVISAESGAAARAPAPLPSLGARKPLGVIPARVGVPSTLAPGATYAAGGSAAAGAAAAAGGGAGAPASGGAESFYSVMFTKQTLKKHKTYDDGILVRFSWGERRVRCGAAQGRLVSDASSSRPDLP
jgi:hypothetical protein